MVVSDEGSRQKAIAEIEKDGCYGKSMGFIGTEASYAIVAEPEKTKAQLEWERLNVAPILYARVGLFRGVDPGELLTDSPDGLAASGKRYAEIAPAEIPIPAEALFERVGEHEWRNKQAIVRKWIHAILVGTKEEADIPLGAEGLFGT